MTKLKAQRHLLPRQHKKVNKLDKALKTQEKGLSKNEQLLLSAVRDILQKQRENLDDKDLKERNINFVRYVIDNFGKLLEPYVKDYSKTIGLQEIVKQVVKEETKETEVDVSNDVMDILKAAIKNMQTPSVTVQSDVKVGNVAIPDNFEKSLDSLFKNDKITKELKSQQDQLKKLYIENKRRFTLNNNATKSNGSVFGKIIHSSSRLGTSMGTKGTKDVRKSGFLSFGNVFKGNKLALSGKQVAEQNSKLLKIIRRCVEKNFVKYDMGKSHNLYRRIKLAFSHTFERIKDTLSSVFGVLKKIGGIAFGALKFLWKISLIGPIFKGMLALGKGVFKMIGVLGKGLKKLGNGLIKVMNFLQVFDTLKEIGNLTKKAVKNTLAAFLTTPKGIYMLGFAAGYLSVRIGKIIENVVVNPIRKLMDNGETSETFAYLWAQAQNFYDSMYNDIIHPVLNFFMPIISTTGDVVKAILNFGWKHPVISSIILTAIPVLQTMLGYPLTMQAVKHAGNPISALMAGALVFACEGIVKIFTERHGDTYKIGEEKRRKYWSINLHQTTRDLMTEKQREKYDFIIGKIDEEANELGQDMDAVRRLSRTYGSETSKTKKHAGVFADFPELVDDIYNGSLLFDIDEEQKKRYQDFIRNSTGVDLEGNVGNRKSYQQQLQYLSDEINLRFTKLIRLKENLAQSDTVEDLEKKMNNLGNVDVNGNSYKISPKIQNAFNNLALAQQPVDQYKAMSIIDQLKYDLPWGRTSSDDRKEYNKALADVHSTFSTGIKGKGYQFIEDKQTEMVTTQAIAGVNVIDTTRTQKRHGMVSLKNDIDNLDKMFGAGSSNIIREKITVGDVLNLEKSSTEERNKFFERLIKEHREQYAAKQKEREQERKNMEQDEINKLNADTTDKERRSNAMEIILKNDEQKHKENPQDERYAYVDHWDEPI